ncbi:DUF4245 family protein [Nocardioides sp. MH1]|uniref:DUF4245 family protein n=1 Tax=Nocardioides sp. MH1 TaxID=3242490 RepID=UPI003520FBC9
MSTTSVGRPGKYQRSAGGLIAALVITVVAVGGLLWFLGLFRADVDNRPEPIDYRSSIDDAQEGRLDPVYLGSLPDGWIATKFDVEPAGEDSAFATGLFTDDEKFVGIEQQTATVDSLLDSYVDKDATTTDIFRADGSVADAWQGYEDAGGDAAYASTVHGQTVLVYGDVAPGVLQDVIDRLTTAPVTR